MKKIVCIMLSLTFTAGAFAVTGCTKFNDDNIDETKSQLRIANYNGGVGELWLDNVAAKFAEEYADHSFEAGKVGVQIHIDHDKTYDGLSLSTSLGTDENDLYFTQQFSYFDNIDYLYDMTDLVEEYVGEDGKTIQSKMSDTNKTALARNGKYYALPFYELYCGVNYDAGVFNAQKLYFADTIVDGERPFVAGTSTPKSCGPDGVKGTYDDGLPSSYEEFYRLLDKMRLNNVIPFVWTGKSSHYTNQLVSALFANYVGADGLSLMYEFEGGPLEVVTGFNGDKPIIETVESVGKDEAYKIRSAAGLYYALEFAHEVFTDNRNYHTSSTSGTSSHLNAMEVLMNSGLDGKEYTAMLIDGNYWYNEADTDGIFDRLQSDYPSTYTRKDIRFLPFPRQYSGTVTEGNGTSPVLVDTYSSYTFINKNTDETTANVAKKFLSYLYSDEQLRNFTVDTNGVIIGVDYDFITVKDQVSEYSRSVLEMREAAVLGNSFVRPISNDPIYMYNQSYFNLVSNSYFWESTVNDAPYTTCYTAFRGNVSAKDYFLGMAISADKWANSFNKY